MWKNFHSIFKFPFNQNTIMIYGINDIDTSRCEVQIKVYLALRFCWWSFESYFPQYFHTFKILGNWRKKIDNVKKYLIVYMGENYLDYDGNMDPN